MLCSSRFSTTPTRVSSSSVPGAPSRVCSRCSTRFSTSRGTSGSTRLSTEEADFVDGVYGPRTTDAVVAYKAQYDIHFPPSAPTGFIDGFAGPRSFAKLDVHCVLLDEAIAAILAKVDDLNADGVPCDLVNSEHAALPILGTSGTFSPAHVDGASGAVLYKRGIGAFEVHGPIWDAYLAGPFASAGFGFPVSDLHRVEDPFIRQSDFEHGFMTVNPDTGEVGQIGPETHVPEAGLF